MGVNILGTIVEACQKSWNLSYLCPLEDFMLPEEAQATMAKVLLMIFATLIFCFSKARAFDHSVNLEAAKIIISK